MPSEEDKEKARWAEFFGAAASGDVAALGEKLGRRRPEDARGKVYEWVELTDQQERTAYLIAAENGQSEALKFLASRGADIRAADTGGESALHAAATKGHPEACAAIVGLGVPVDHPSKNGETALLLASRRGKFDVVRRLLALGADPKVADRLGITALLGATRGNHKEICLALLAAGASIQAADRTGASPIALAQPELTKLFWWTSATAGDVPALRKLLARQIGAAGDEGFQDLGRALFTPQGQDQVLLNLHRELINCKDSLGFTAISRAVQAGAVSTVEYLISQTADASISDDQRETPLHHAVRMGHLGIVEQLIEDGSSLDAINNGDFAPLHIAAYLNHHAVVEALCKAGASVNITDKLHATPLHYATGRRHNESIQLLVKHGASLSIRDKDYKTAADWAYEANRAFGKPRPRLLADVADYDEVYVPAKEAQRYVVCHSTRVAVRSAPSAEGKITGARFPGEEVFVSETRNGYAKIEPKEAAKPGVVPPEMWMLIDGKAHGLGPLLKREDKPEPQTGAADDDSDEDDDFAG